MTRRHPVNCPNISITKVAVDPSVNATDASPSTSSSERGPRRGLNLAINDPLPTNAGTTWTIDAANSDAGWTIEGGALKFASAALPPAASRSGS